MKLFREPLLHFLILGAGLFLLFGAVADRTGERVDQIVVSSGQIDHLVEVWTKTRQRPPSSSRRRPAGSEWPAPTSAWVSSISLAASTTCCSCWRC